MAATIEKIEHDLLKLSKQERAFLADRLLSSLDGDVLNDIDVAWELYSKVVFGSRGLSGATAYCRKSQYNRILPFVLPLLSASD